VDGGTAVAQIGEGDGMNEGADEVRFWLDDLPAPRCATLAVYDGAIAIHEMGRPVFRFIPWRGSRLVRPFVSWLRMSIGQAIPLTADDIVWRAGEEDYLAEFRPRWPADFSIFVQFRDEAHMAGCRHRLESVLESNRQLT
jgi:hypothetical protein